jgi:hypothetical protein
MKRILFGFGVFILLSAPALAASFPDVPEDHENFEAIEYLDDQGIINGYDDGTFGPENFVNRAEAMKMVVGALGIEKGGTYSDVFPDVYADQWYYPYVMAGYANEIIDGYDDGTFRPEDEVNLAELLKIIVLGAEVDLDEVEDAVFIDVPAEEWYAPHALYARNHNIIFPDEYGYLNAGQSMTRGAFAEVVYRMMIVLENGGESYPLDKNWDDYESDFLPFSINFDSEYWEIIENENEVIFFRPDFEYQQFSPMKIYPNTAVVTVTLDPNSTDLDIGDYFSNIEEAFVGGIYTEFEIDALDALEVLYSEDRVVDWYVYLDSGEVLVVYTEFGDGALGYQNNQVIKTMLGSLKYRDLDFSGEDFSELLSEIFENVLVEDMGMEMLDKLPDKLIIETDTIGVGTGPVDYYYSEGVDYTFKYERADDVILDTREGHTTTF